MGSGIFGSGLLSQNFKWLWIATLGSSAGMWVQQVAVGWLVLEMTDSPLALGFLAVSRAAPFLVFGMLAGAAADRLDRRRLLMAVQAGGAVYGLSMTILVSTDLIALWHVLALTFLFGCVHAFDSPSRQSLVYDLVGAEEALRGISLNAIAQRITGVLSGVLSGVLIPLAGVEGCFLLMAVSYALGVASLMVMQPVSAHHPVTADRPGFWDSVSAGVNLVRTNPVVRLLIVLSMTAEMFAFSHATLTPVFARDILLSGPVGLGLLSSARAVGGIIATFVLASLTYYQDKVRLLLLSMAVFGFALVFFSFSSSFLLSFVILVVIGGAATSFDLLQQTVLQLNVPNELRGRVMGYWVASLGFGPIGHLELGALATAAGAPFAQMTNGLIVVLSVLAALVWLRRSGVWHTQVGHPVPVATE